MNITFTKDTFSAIYKENLEVIDYFCLRMYEINDEEIIQSYNVLKGKGGENYLPIQKLVRKGYLKADSSITDNLFSLTEKGKELLKNC